MKLPQEEKKELVNSAARLLSWATGSQTYNDFEVVGKPSQHFGFVSLRIDSSHSVKRGGIAKEVLAILTVEQKAMLIAAAAENVEEFEHFLSERAKLMRTLEVALSGNDIDTELVRKFGSAVGQVEASMTWAQAKSMLAVRNRMTDSQTLDLLALRSKYIVNSETTAPKDAIARGRQLYAQCTLCHNASKAQAAGPNLTGIVGRAIAVDKQYTNYSSAMRSFASLGNQRIETVLNQFLKSPTTLIPGTYMSFDGIESSTDRAAVIAFLRSQELSRVD